MSCLRVFPQHAETGGCTCWCGCSMNCIKWLSSHNLAREKWHRFGNKQLGGGKVNWLLRFRRPPAQHMQLGDLSWDSEMAWWLWEGWTVVTRLGWGDVGWRGSVSNEPGSPRDSCSFCGGTCVCVVLSSRKCQMCVYRLELPSKLCGGLHSESK